MARRAGTRRDGSGRAEEAARTTRRWFEFEHALPLFGFYLPTSLVLRRAISFYDPFSLSVALVISIRPLLSPSLYTAAASSSSLASFLTLGERILSTILSLSLSSLPRASSSRDSRIGSRSTSLWLFPSFYLSRSIYPPSSGAREHRVSIRLRSALRICFLAPVLSFSLLPPALRRARFSRSFFRCSTASRSSLRSIAMRETGRARGGEARAEEEKEDEEEEEGGGGGGRGRRRRRRVHVPSRSTGRNWYIGG